MTGGRFSWRSSLLLILGAALSVGAVSCSPLPSLAASTAVYERDTSGGLYDITPVRGAVRPLRLRQDGDEYECTMCHDGFHGDKGEEALEDQHADIKFDHGLNLRCLNCHNPTNSMAYVNHDGSEIPDDQPTRLCAKCHGPHYREWLLGIHGRVNGNWNAYLDEKSKLACIQCHDPHRPRFQQMAPEPPPTLTRFEDALRGGPAHG